MDNSAGQSLNVELKPQPYESVYKSGQGINEARIEKLSIRFHQSQASTPLPMTTFILVGNLIEFDVS